MVGGGHASVSLVKWWACGGWWARVSKFARGGGGQVVVVGSSRWRACVSKLRGFYFFRMVYIV